jgi:hypothetical protein
MSTLLKFAILLFFGAIGAVGIATGAGAYFSTHEAGTGVADVGALQAPTDVAATFPNPDVRTVNVSWSAPSEPSGITIQGYYVQSYVGATPSPACGTSPTALVTTLTCSDTDVPSNTYTYIVTAVFRSWSAPSAPSGLVTVPAPKLTSFSLDPSTNSPGAGTPFTTALTAMDQYGEVDVAYSGPECVVFSGADASPSGANPQYPASPPCSEGSALTFVDGVASGANSAQITLFDAVSTDLVATDVPTGVNGSTTLDVSPGPLSAFDVANPGTQTAGVAFDDGITAVDTYGNTVTAYTGTQELDFSGPSGSPSGSTPTYPSSVDFFAGVGDIQQITLVDAQTTSLTAIQNTVSGTSTPFVVNAGAAAVFSVANPGDQTAGVAFDDTITALDSFGNVATGFAGPQTIDFSGPSNSPNGSKPSYPSSVDFAAGIGTAQQITLVDAQSTILTASQSSLTGTSTSFVVGPGPANYYAVAVPPAAAVSDPFAVTITAFDQYANVATGYSGTANLVPAAGGISPTSITLQDGTVEFDATLDTPGNQTITATDSTTASITGESGVIVVSSGATATYSVTYVAGAATSGLPPVDSTNYSAGSKVTVLANSGNLAETGYVFGGWSTGANDTGTPYQPGDTFTIEANTTLYPIFTLSAATYSVTYVAGAATSGLPPVDSTSYSAGSKVTVLANSGNLAETGYVFGGWSTGANDTGTPYQPGDTFTIEANTTLYPIFTLVSPMITTPSLASATQGETNYSQTLQGTGGTTPYKWTITKGTLPRGLSVNTLTGTISGTVSAHAATETFTVTLTAASGASTSKQFTITVYATLEITTTSLASATQGEVNYSQTLQGTGGETPYTWSISQGFLPSGLSLNSVTGVISGTLSAKAASETFTVTLSSANGSVTTRQFTITVSPCHTIPAPPPPPHISPIRWCWNWCYRPVFGW